MRRRYTVRRCGHLLTRPFASGGSIDGKALKLTVEAQTPQGAMTVIMTGDIDGDAILNGKAEIAGMGQMQWTAKRARQ